MCVYVCVGVRGGDRERRQRREGGGMRGFLKKGKKENKCLKTTEMKEKEKKIELNLGKGKNDGRGGDLEEIWSSAFTGNMGGGERPG
jgi:hypothetical protein